VHRLTFSQAPRLELCPPSGFLPVSRQVDADEARDFGTALHAFLRDVSLLGREAALEHAPEEHRRALEAVDESKLPASRPDQYAVEVSFAWDPTTDAGRELARGTDARDYSTVKPHQWAGTADVLGLTDEEVIVWDYKSGWRALEAPGDHLQLLGYAVAAARAYGKDAAWVGFIRYPKGGEPYFVSERLDLLQLDMAAERLKLAAEAVAARRYELAEGQHCQYCPSFSHCPAKAVLLGSLVKATAAIDPRSPELAPSTDLFPMPLTEANFPEVLRRYELATDLLERVKSQLEHFAGNRAIHLGGDEFWGKVPRPHETIDPVKGAEALSKVFGEEVARNAVEHKTTLTKEALDLALRKWMEKQPPAPKEKGKRAPGITAFTEKALEAIRDAGATKTSTTYGFRRFKPPKPKKEPKAA
jgi:RecB family exonuclease